MVDSAYVPAVEPYLIEGHEGPRGLQSLLENALTLVEVHEPCQTFPRVSHQGPFPLYRLQFSGLRVEISGADPMGALSKLDRFGQGRLIILGVGPRQAPRVAVTQRNACNPQRKHRIR